MILALLACSSGDPPAQPPRPTLGVAVPLSGPDAALGEAAVHGVALAAGTELDVMAVDDSDPQVTTRLAASPAVIGVVAHVTRGPAGRLAEAWEKTDLPVVYAGPGGPTGVPRVVPSLAASVRCASGFLDANFHVRTDGAQPSMTAGQALLDTIPQHAIDIDTVDSAHVSAAAGRVAGPRLVVWVGDASGGGNLLRALRQVGSAGPFLGIGGHDPKFLAAAGSAAAGARVTAEGRPARNEAFRAAYRARAGNEPGPAAVDAYEAAAMLVAAWRVAAQEPPPLTRDLVRVALPTATADGANGPMHFGPDGALEPVVCGEYLVERGGFTQVATWSEADPPPEKK